MSVLYISNIGQMACFNDFVWINARLESVIDFIRKNFFESDYKSSSDETVPEDE